MLFERSLTLFFQLSTSEWKVWVPNPQNRVLRIGRTSGRPDRTFAPTNILSSGYSCWCKFDLSISDVGEKFVS